MGLGRYKLQLPNSTSYQKLLSLLSRFHVKTHHQYKTFLDGTTSELSSQPAIFRLRIISIKAKVVLVDGVSTVKENEDLDPLIGSECIMNPSRLSLIDSRVLRRLKDEFGVTDGRYSLGGFRNVRAVYEWNGLKLEVDETMFDFGTSYEIECEKSELEKAKKLLEDFLKENGLLIHTLKLQNLQFFDPESCDTLFQLF